MRTRHAFLGGSVATIAASSCFGAVTYLTQDRSITAATTFDGTAQTVAAPDFARFAQTINLSTTFPGLNNTVGLNEAVAGIDCQLDPNKIKATGRLLARGGTSFVNGKDTVESGSASATIRTTFHLDSASAFQLVASPRPLAGPKDKFKLKIESADTGVILLLDESTPPAAVNTAGLFAAGDYSLEYQIELSAEDGTFDDSFEMVLVIPTPGVLGLAGSGVLAVARRRR